MHSTNQADKTWTSHVPVNSENEENNKDVVTSTSQPQSKPNLSVAYKLLDSYLRKSM